MTNFLDAGTFPIGSKIPFKVRLRQRTNDSLDGTLVGASGASVSVTSPSGTADTSGAALTFLQDGEYIYYFDTAGKAAGNYRVDIVVRANNAGDEVRKTVTFRLRG